MDPDPAVVDLIQLAIAEDMKLLEMLHNQETKDQILESILASEIEGRADTIEAARILVNLVLGAPL